MSEVVMLNPHNLVVKMTCGNKLVCKRTSCSSLKFPDTKKKEEEKINGKVMTVNKQKDEMCCRRTFEKQLCTVHLGMT